MTELKGEYLPSIGGRRPAIDPSSNEHEWQGVRREMTTIFLNVHVNE